MDNVFKAMGMGLSQRINAWIAEWTPRQAFVTRSAGNGVFVRFSNEGADAPESQFVSTVSGVPAGTMGWVITLGGGKGLFIVTGIHTVPFAWWVGSAVSTTSLATPTMLINESITLPPGTWKLTVNFGGYLWRSVNSGDRRMYLNMDGSDGFVIDPSGSGAPKNVGFYMERPNREMTINITTERAVPLQLGVYGNGTTGTTNLAYGKLNGQAVRIGGPT